MNTYEPEFLLSLWKRGQIDSDMAIGHLLQNLVLQQESIRKMNEFLQDLSPSILDHTTQLSLRPPARNRKRR